MKVLVCGLLLSLGCVAAHAQDQEVWTVRSDGAKCILDNYASYLQSPQDVLMLVLPSCPEADVVKAMSAMTQNTVLPGVGVGHSDAMDDIVFYTREELSCLVTMSFDLTGETVQWPKKPTC